MNSHIWPSCCLPTQEKSLGLKLLREFGGTVLVSGTELQQLPLCIFKNIFFVFRTSLSWCTFVFLLTFCPLCFIFKPSFCACTSLSSFHTLYFSTPFTAVISLLPRLSATFCFLEGFICEPNINKTVGMKNQYLGWGALFLFFEVAQSLNTKANKCISCCHYTVHISMNN